MAERANVALSIGLIVYLLIAVRLVGFEKAFVPVRLTYNVNVAPLTPVQERRQIGWFYWSRHDTQKMGVHRVTRENLGDFWKHRNGQYKTITGLCRNGRGSFAVRLEMWIPGTDTSSDWNGMLSR